MMHYSIANFFLLLLLLCGCSETQNSSRKHNVHGEAIFRKKDMHILRLSPPEKKARKPFYWEDLHSGKHARITKDFFRCKGCFLNPAIVKKQEGKDAIYFRDCGGGDHHSLPMKEGKEFIYPCLIDLLNYIQEKTGKKVVITTGHRCPEHNTYCDSSPANFGSKHMVGAEVDFYVEGMEKEPEAIVALLQNFYRTTAPFKGDKEYETFHRFDKDKLNVSTPPWYNKEIFIKLYRPHEGRDFDNTHPHSYIGIQVRYDRASQTKVAFEPAAAKNYLRY